MFILLWAPLLLFPVLGVEVSCGLGVRKMSLGGLRMEGGLHPLGVVGSSPGVRAGSLKAGFVPVWVRF